MTDLMNALHPAVTGAFNLRSLVEQPFPVKWTPRIVGDLIEGQVIWRRNEIWYGEPVPVLYILKTDGDFARVIGSTVQLRRQIVDQDVQPSDMVAIRYDGQKKLDSDRVMKLFSLAKGPGQ